MTIREITITFDDGSTQTLSAGAPSVEVVAPDVDSEAHPEVPEAEVA